MLPNWLYGKSKSKLASILGGGGTPADYNQVKAQVEQNTEDIALLDTSNQALTDAISEKYGYLGQKNFTVNKDGTKTWAELLAELVTALHTYCTNNTDRILNVHCITISGILDMQASAGRDFKYEDLPTGLNANGCSSGASEMQIYTLNANINSSSSLLRKVNISNNSSSITDMSASVAGNNIVARCLEFQKFE